MHDALRITARLLELGTARYGRDLARRIATATLLVGGAMACGAVAVGFGIAALYSYLTPIVGQTASALIVAGLFLALCIILLMVSRSRSQPRRSAALPVAELNELVARATHQAKGLAREHSAALLLAAFIGGLVAGKQKNRH